LTDTVSSTPLVGSDAPDALDANGQLLRMRASIDNLDAALVYLLAERFKQTRQVGALKAQASLPPADPEREARQIARLRALAADAELDRVFAEKLLTFIISEVIRHHEAIAAGSSNASGR
jgi:chorismate mutase